MEFLDQVPTFRAFPAARREAVREQLEKTVNTGARKWSWRLSRGVTAGLGISVAAVGGAVAAATITSSGGPTVGPVPNDAVQVNGSFDLSKVPDFVPDLNQAGQIVGYSPKADLFPQHPEPVTVPNVVGMSLATAEGAIKALGLDAVASSERSATVLSGDIVSQMPAANVRLELGSEVRLVSSVGPDGTATSGGSSTYVAPTPQDEAALNSQMIVPVYGPDLKTLVGHMYPGKGFVPLSRSFGASG